MIVLDQKVFVGDVMLLPSCVSLMETSQSFAPTTVNGYLTKLILLIKWRSGQYAVQEFSGEECCQQSLSAIPLHKFVLHVLVDGV